MSGDLYDSPLPRDRPCAHVVIDSRTHRCMICDQPMPDRRSK